jgi:hypothetical protein
MGDPRDTRHLLARIAGLKEPLLESRDAGKSWQPFQASLPAAGVKKLYGTVAGWWAALDGGGLARYDETAQRWQKLEFREEQTTTPPHGRGRAASRSRARIHVTKEADPDVADVFVHETLVYIATSHGVWSGAIREGRLRRMALELFPGSVMAIVVSRAGEEIYAVTPTRFSQTLDSGKTWNNVAAPPEAGELVWLAPMPTAKPSTSASSEARLSWLVGTLNGVYGLTPHNEMPWRLLQSGLPAARPAPPGASATSVAIPMKTGGIYLTRDQGKNWERLDSDAQAGIITGIATDGQGGYFMGSKNEGILHLTLSGFRE